MKTFKDLSAWQEGLVLAEYIYTITKQFPKDELFGLSAQMRRAGVSVASNIAEGMGRQSVKDKSRFLFISRGSLYELETQLEIANKQKYICETDFERGQNQITICRKCLNGLIKYFAGLSNE